VVKKYSLSWGGDRFVTVMIVNIVKIDCVLEPGKSGEGSHLVLETGLGMPGV
jgi:hypothetical protein